MAAKSQYSSPEAEYVESPDRPSIRDLASKWNQPVSSLLKQSSKERWTEKRNQFGIKLESKTTEKTVEKVSEKVSTDKAEVIARQVKNSRGLQSIGVALGVKLQGALAQLGAVLENNGYIFCGHCGKSTPTKCGKCGMMHETTPLRPDQAVKIHKDLSAAIAALSKEERVALGIDKPDGAGGDTINNYDVRVLQLYQERGIEEW